MIRERDANNNKNPPYPSTITFTHYLENWRNNNSRSWSTNNGDNTPSNHHINHIENQSSRHNKQSTVSEHLMPSWREQTHSECNEDSSITCDKNRTGATRNQLYNRKIFATKMRLKPNQISIIYVCRILWTCVIIFIDCTLNMYKCISHHQHLVPLNGLVRAMPLHTR